MAVVKHKSEGLYLNIDYRYNPIDFDMQGSSPQVYTGLSPGEH